MKKVLKKRYTILILASAMAGLSTVVMALPVKVPDLVLRDGTIRNPITWEQLHNITGPKEDGLELNVGAEINGKICSGPYPFEYGEAEYDYARYRNCKDLENGVGVIETDRYFSDKYNANEWPEGQCDDAQDCPTTTIGYRLVTEAGFFDARMSFTGKGTSDELAEPQTTLVEGPFINHVRSDDPNRVLITFETDRSCTPKVEVPGMGTFTAATGVVHEIWITGLKQDREYSYQVQCNDVRSGVYPFRTAPNARQYSDLKFAFASDSREGPSGEESFMGHNFKILSAIAADADRRGAKFMIFGGDLVNGYTSEVEDFRLQLKAWKKSMEGFWRSHPVYPAMGNHETLMNVYDDGSQYGISLDKWPYETDSAEALFAQEFWNPTNGPDASNERPTYKENVYSFQYGPVLFVAFNNNYWWTTNSEVPNYGGSPEGYMLDDQLAWIEDELNRAEQDRGIKYVFLYAQEPVFPAGGHVKDAMWWKGDNTISAYQYDGDTVVPAGPGIVDVRNRFWGAIANSSKVAAVLTGDEHAYHRVLINDKTPVGLPSEDDLDGNGKLDDGRISPNPDFICPTWQLTAGNAGAPWYAREETPWDVQLYSSQIGYPLFEVTRRGVSMTVHSLTGQVLDHIDNLMDVKQRCRASIRRAIAGRP